MRLAEGGNRWDWEDNGYETWLYVGARMRMGMNDWAREGVRLKKIFPFISRPVIDEIIHNNNIMQLIYGSTQRIAVGYYKI